MTSSTSRIAGRAGFHVTAAALEAGVVVMAVPCLLVFLLLQRHYVRGFMTGAVRG
jgi:multiple sugar transport system permease protein